MNDRPTALLLPGQGEERPGMALAALGGAAARLLDRASERLGLDLAAVIRRGSPLLATTELAQPAVTAISLGLALDLERCGVSFDAVAGHSLGELAAFAVAGCLDPEDAIDLACLRGALMADAARRRPGGMFALRASSEAEVEEVLAHGRAHGLLDVAARNAPNQWVLSGERSAVQAVEARYSVTRLSVAGPWHSVVMEPARAAWLQALRAVDLAPPRKLLIANRDGKRVTPDADVADVLASQLTRPIAWSETLATLVRAGIQGFVLLGAARALKGLVRDNLGPKFPVRTVAGDVRILQHSGGVA